MSDRKRLVYSTETGSLRKRSKQTKSSADTTAIRKAGKQGVRIRRESKGRGGKTVSVIDGLALNEAEARVLLKRLKGRLGTGGAFKNGVLEIQGDHREALRSLLEAEGYAVKLAGG
jgi:translation initiation factor 1